MSGYRPVRVPGSPGAARVYASEARLTKALLDYLRGLEKCWARKVHGSRYQDAGEPDLDGCLRGRAIKCEVKMPGKTPTPVQFAALRRWERAGALAGWVTSREELDDLLEHADDSGWMNPRLSP